MIRSKPVVIDAHFSAGLDSAALPRWRTLPIAFVFLINLPLLAFVVNLGSTPLAKLIHPIYVVSSPKRPAGLNDLPRFVQESRAYFNKAFALRGDFMRAQAVVSQRVFKTSPQQRVLVGLDGWLFLDADGSMENYRRLDPYSAKQLSQRVADIQSRVESCRSHGCVYRLVIPPSKLTVYPEFLGDRYRVADSPARLDQLVEAVTHAGLAHVIVDSRTEMQAAKSYGQLYYKTDTHWNRLGAYVGYQSIARSLAGIGFRDVPPMSELLVGRRPAEFGGDLARMASLRLDCDDQIVDVSRPRSHAINFSGPIDFFAKDAEFFQQPVRDMQCEHGEFETGLILHDSFGSPLLEYLAGHFQTLRSERTTEFDEDAIVRTKPDIVIQVLTERGLHRD